MKKLLAMSMVLIMMAGLTGCGKGGYSSKSKKAITAAESAFDVEEMSNKEKKQFLKNNLRVGTGGFVDGLYVTLDEDDMESIDVDDDSETGYSPEDIKNMTMIAKGDNQSNVSVIVAETKDKDAAETMFKYALKSTKAIKKQIKAEPGTEYNTEDEDEKFSLIAVRESLTVGYYCEISGKVVTIVSISCLEDDDLLEEFYDFMREAGYTDMEELLEDA